MGLTAAALLARVAAAEVFALFVVLAAAALLAAVPLLAALLLAAGFDFAAAFVAEDFAAEVLDSALDFLLTPFATPLESASITMDAAALEDAALEEAVLGAAAVG